MKLSHILAVVLGAAVVAWVLSVQFADDRTATANVTSGEPEIVADRPLTEVRVERISAAPIRWNWSLPDAPRLTAMSS